MVKKHQTRDSMIKKLVIIIGLGISLSGCFMAPLAFIGPAASGFSTASIIQSGASMGFNYAVKQKTGKTFSEHVIHSLAKDTIQQSFLPKNK